MNRRARPSPLLSSALLALLLWAAPPARAELVDRVAAVVDGQVIALSEVQQRAAPELARLTERDPTRRAEARARILKETLDTLVGEKLLEAKVKEAGMSATDAEIDQALADMRRQNGVEDPEQFEQALRAEGFTVAQYRELLGRQLARMKFVQYQVASKVKVSEQDLKAEYAQLKKQRTEEGEVHARHILVEVPADAPADKVEKARQRALAIRAEAVRPGMDFAALARARSEGPSREDGGDLGFFGRGVMMPAFEQTAFGLKVGEVSEPVRTRFGWHVIKVEERRAAPVPEFDEAKPELTQKLQRERTESALRQYVAELKQKASVEVKL